MRYLIAVSSLTPGSGLTRYVFSLCGQLADRNEVFVVTTHNSANISYEEKELADISDRIKLLSLGKYSTSKKYLKAIRLVWSIKPDIIINNYNGVYQFILPFIPKRIKVVHILHADTDDFYRIASINAEKVSGWIAPSDAIADHFNNYTSNKYKDRVTVIPHGVEEAERLDRHNDCLEIVFAGVIYEHKGVKILPQIIKGLLNKEVDLHFTVIGEGILFDWLKEQFSKEMHAGTVTMTGVIAHTDVYKLMSKADIFLYPTHLDSFGLVIAEAMMNGAIPVVTHLPNITDKLIPDNQYGFLIPQDDVDKFVSTISNLYASKELQNLISINAHRRALECYSHKAMKDAYLNYLTNLM